MRIVYAHRTRGTGVEAVHIGQIVQGMRKLGHGVEMLSPVGDFIEHVSPRVEGISATQGRLAGLGARLPEILFELLEIAYSVKASIEGMRRFPAGSIHGVYERYAIFGFAGMWLARRRAVPLVLEVNYTCLTPLVRPRSRLLLPLAKWLDRRLFRGATHLLAVSSFLKRQLIDEFGVEESRITVVPNAADPAVFDPEKVLPQAPAATPGVVIGFVGGFYPWHGLDLLLDAFTSVAKDYPQATLLLIGDGPMRPALLRRVEASGLKDRVQMPGKIAHNQLAPAIARFDIGVMPDSNTYGSPMKIFEYMAMAVPVVVPDYAPLQDVVTDGVQGRIFRRGDAPQLAACIAEMMANPAERARMGQRARQAIVSRHNWLSNASLAINRISA